jgi:hypothetical protein
VRDNHRVPIEVIRRWLLGLVAAGLAGFGTELLLLGHYEGPAQFIPFVLIVAGFAAIGWHLLTRTAVSVLAFRSVMVLLVLAGLLGIVLHYRGNMEFQLETDPTAHGFALFMKILHAKAPPALAPAALSQLGLLGLVYTYRHPALTSAHTRDIRGES